MRRNDHAVGSHSLSTSITHNGSGAVCFLWHFPSTGFETGCPDVIRHTALWSSDFPLAALDTRERPSGPAAYVSIIFDSANRTAHVPPSPHRDWYFGEASLRRNRRSLRKSRCCHAGLSTYTTCPGCATATGSLPTFAA